MHLPLSAAINAKSESENAKLDNENENFVVWDVYDSIEKESNICLPLIPSFTYV